MKLKIAICDDARDHAEQIRSDVTAWAAECSHRCDTVVFPSAEALIFGLADSGNFDILLLDVEMPGMDGISLAKKLRRDGVRSEIIFITSHFEFAGEGYEVDALHYLVKPVSRERLSTVLGKATERLAVEPPFVVISCDGETVKLYESEILYVEALLHYIMIRTKDREYKIKENLSSFAEKLSDDFYHTHRSYYVSLKHVTRISRSSVTLEGGYEIPLSRGKYDEINRAYIERN